MIDLRERPETGWNLLLGVSLLAIVATGLYGILWSPSAPPGKATSAALTQAENSISRAERESAASDGRIDTKVWDLPAEALGPQVLERLTAMSDTFHVGLSGFRSEKPVEVAALSEVPFVVTVEGRSLTLRASFRAEAPDSKLAVNLVQLSSSDANAGGVIATLGLVGFLRKEVK